LAQFLKHADDATTFAVQTNYPVTTRIKLAPGVEAVQVIAPRVDDEK
jgi:hypothetical protein